MIYICIYLGDIDERIANVNEYLTFSLYSNVCRSLFEKNKLQFALLLCVRILLDQGLVDTHEWMFLLSGGSPIRVSLTAANTIDQANQGPLLS